MKKKTLAFLLSACLLTQSAGFVSAADFSAVPEEAANAEEIFSPEANATDSDPSDNLSATSGDDFSDEHPDHMTTTDSGAASEESKVSSDLDADTNPDSTTNTESAPSVSDSVTNPETDQDVELLPEETMPEDVELEPEASSTENDSELSQELLFDDGESDTFNDGNDSSSAAFASSKIPDHDIWLADTVKTGLVVDGKNIQTKSLYNLITQPSVKPVYQELGERILSNKPMLVLSSIWKGVIKQEFYDDQKLIYEALLADYLQFVDSTDSKDFDSSQIERANSYLIKMFNDLSTYYTQNGVYNWKPEDFMKLDAEEANKLLQSVDSMKTAVSLVGDACSTTKELVELCTKVNAFKNAADERILLIQKARNAGSSNTAFVEACDAILAQLGSQSIDVSYLRSQSASAAMKKCTETMISELSKQNPALKALSYGSSAMDILFNTSSINSDNLKLSLLYTMDCYFNTALTSSSYTYARYKNTENANAFVKCFQGYTTFQIYANNIAKSYISGVTSGGALNRTFADIFYREGVKNAESWKNLCDGQINIRRGILDVLAKFYQLYNRFYLKAEYTNALKDQITATPTPTPRPLVPVDYEVTVPESKNPVKDSLHYGSDGDGWSYFKDGTVIFFGKNFPTTTYDKCSYSNVAKKVIVCEGFTSVNTGYFSEWSNLKSIWLPDTLTHIHSNAFKDCKNLETIRLSSQRINLGSSAFENCVSLKTLTMPSEYINADVGYGGSSAFKDCINLESITLPSNLNQISYGWFENCTNLRNIVLPDTIELISKKAFINCSNLNNINIPDSVTSLGKYAFRDCIKLQSVTIPGEISSHWTYCGSIFSNGTYNYYHGLAEGVFYNCTNLKKAIFKSGKSTQLIGAYTFAGCSKLEKVTLPDNIKFIDHHAFDNCENLTQINLQYVQSICIGAFENCSKLKTVQFPKDNIKLSKNAFQNCTSLESISLSGTIGENSFGGCSNLKKVVLLKVDSMGGYAIGNSAFSDCKNLTEIIFPKDSVITNRYSIGEKSFYNCVKLKNIIIPDTVESIGAQCFYNCKSLQSVTLSKYIIFLTDEEFANCNNLKSVIFLGPKDNHTFESNPNAFNGCSSLKSIYGYPNTSFEIVAKKLGIPFISLDTPLTVPSGLTLTPGNKYFKSTWKKTAFINGYQLQYSRNKNFSKSVLKTIENNTSIASTAKNLIANQIYYVRIRTYRKIGQLNQYSKWSTPKAVTVLPIKVSTASAPVLKSGKQYFRASWKKTSGTSGYQIQYSLYKNFKNPVTKTLAGSTKNNITVSKLKRNKRYYVRVRAYRNANSKKYYGKWSGIKSIIVK